ncbi:hypothetical protein [Streptomyces sp. NPDC006463]|uniref:hypothetical protein n=1 Tax=Streptomyces sp. NPDC006463 TaxID=3364746 RepID=UPI0036899E43
MADRIGKPVVAGPNSPIAAAPTTDASHASHVANVLTACAAFVVADAWQFQEAAAEPVGHGLRRIPVTGPTSVCPLTDLAPRQRQRHGGEQHRVNDQACASIRSLCCCPAAPVSVPP